MRRRREKCSALSLLQLPCDGSVVAKVPRERRCEEERPLQHLIAHDCPLALGSRNSRPRGGDITCLPLERDKRTTSGEVVYHAPCNAAQRQACRILVLFWVVGMDRVVEIARAEHIVGEAQIVVVHK